MISIDPGGKGAGAVLKVEHDVKLERVCAFSITPDWEATLQLWCYVFDPGVIAFERVSRGFAFGRANGSAMAALKLAGRKDIIRYIEPTKWRRRLGLPKNSHIAEDNKRYRQNKKDGKALALQLYPQLCEVKGDVFDAVLIGHAAVLDILKVPLGALQFETK